MGPDGVGWQCRTGSQSPPAVARRRTLPPHIAARPSQAGPVQVASRVILRARRPPSFAVAQEARYRRYSSCHSVAPADCASRPAEGS